MTTIEQVTKEQMIEKIYQEIGQYKNNELYLISKYNTETDKTEILWSNNQMPVFIGDCLDWINENTPDNENRNMIFNYWHKLRLPIEEQSEECITYIYNLLFNK